MEAPRVLSFDCYGTLIDWETGLLRAFAPWRERTGVAAADEELLAAFGRAESRREQASPGAPYPRILESVLEDLSGAFGAPALPAECRAFGASVGDWPPFPDSGPALTRLGERFRLVILSNVDRASFQRSEAALGLRFDAVYTAEEIGSYKPDPANFRYLLEAEAREGFAAGDLLHVAQSLYHDHGPAKALGLRTAWVDRRGARGGGAAPEPTGAVEPDLVVPDLASLADRLLALPA